MYRVYVFFFKQKTAYEMDVSDWSSDVCSSDLDVADPLDGVGVLDPHEQVPERDQVDAHAFAQLGDDAERLHRPAARAVVAVQGFQCVHGRHRHRRRLGGVGTAARDLGKLLHHGRSEEHTSELQSLMRISYAVLCLKKK